MKIGYLMQMGEDIRRPPFNGPANHVRQVVAELQRQGHQVRVLYGLNERLWQTDDLEQFVPVPAPVLQRGPLRLGERAVRRVQSELRLPYLAFFESLRFAAACRRALAGYDVLYERASWARYGGALAACWLGVPLVLEYNGDPLEDLEAKRIAPRGLQRLLSVALMRATLRAAAHIVATGAGWRRNLIGRWGVDPARVTTVENGSELTRLLRREQLRSFQPEADAGPLTLVYLGGFYPWHGLSILLPALARACAQGYDLRLALIGAGVGLEETRQQARALGLEERVQFMGHLSAGQYAPILAAADIGLSPYCGWKEFSGLKLFDYKAAGLAVIASGQDGQPATLRHGVTGWIVPPCDEEALAAAIVRLAQDAELRRGMGQRARLEAEAIHGWDHTARQLSAIFTQVVGR